MPKKEKDEGTSTELQSVSDSVLQETIKKLAERKERLQQIDEELKEAFDLKRGKISSMVAKTLNAFIPKQWHSKLPAGLVKYCVEESDALEFLETVTRDNINNIQLELRILAACALAKRSEMEQLEQDLKRAETENWTAKELQAYMAKRANIAIYKEVAQLLDVEFKALSDEQREERKQYLLNQLRVQVDLGYDLITTMSKVCGGSLQVFHTAIAQYAAYVNAMRPMQKIRDVAGALVSSNTAMYAGPSALRETFKASIQALATAMDAAQKVDRYSLASGDLKSLLESGRAELEQLEYKKEK